MVEQARGLGALLAGGLIVGRVLHQLRLGLLSAEISGRRLPLSGAVRIELGIGQAVHGSGRPHASWVESNDVVGRDEVVREVSVHRVHQGQPAAAGTARVDEERTHGLLGGRTLLQRDLDRLPGRVGVVQGNLGHGAQEGPVLGLLDVVAVIAGVPLQLLVIELLQPRGDRGR